MGMRTTKADESHKQQFIAASDTNFCTKQTWVKISMILRAFKQVI